MTVEQFPLVIQRGCGMDVHRDTVVASVKGSDIEMETKTFGTFTTDLYDLVGWLQSKGVSHIVMESTGVYWKPVYYILEEFFEVLLVNARHVKNVPGHKTDKADSRWLTKLLLSGLLKGSFVPAENIRELRVLNRHRKKLIGQRTSEKNRLQNILEDANIKLRSVVSDVFGKSGMAMIEAIIKGETNPDILSDKAKGSLVRKKDLLRKALNGRITDHHRFMLKMMLENINHINNQIAQIEARMNKYLESMSQEVSLLKTIPGVSDGIARGIIAEIGIDMSHFPSHKHLSSWAGICPGNNESAGKKYSSKTTKGNKYLKSTLVEAAWVASRSKTNLILANKHKTLSIRRGSKKATIAIGNKILIAAYHILRDKIQYKPHTQDEKIVAQRRMKKIERLERQLKTLKQTP